MALVLRTPSHRSWRYYGNPQSWFTPALLSRSHGIQAWDPRITVKKDNGMLKYRIEVEDAGPGDLDVSVSEGVITVRGERRQEREIEHREYGWREISQSSFCRSLSLPRSADWEKAEASFDEGVLEVSMTVTEAEPKRIEIQTARQ
ncbi:MAG: Hsp20/alpha crystallin family protein [Thermoleophilia bacterium]